MKTSPRPKANPKGKPMVKSLRPKAAGPARAVRKGQAMLDSAARAGDGYAKGGMVKGGKCPKCGKSMPCMACGGMTKGKK